MRFLSLFGKKTQSNNKKTNSPRRVGPNMYAVVRAKISASRLAARARAKRARPTVSPRRNNMKLGPSPRRNNGVSMVMLNNGRIVPYYNRRQRYSNNRQGGMWN